MKVLVTGGAGFIGSHLVGRLLERGDDVRVLDDLSTGSRANLAGRDRDVDLHQRDLRDLDAVRTAARDVEVVFHLGARVSVQRSLQDPAGTREVNIVGARNVLWAARDQAVRRVVLASSSSVYGNSGTLPRAETTRPEPVSPYAESKLAAERHAARFARRHPLEAVSLRYFNVYGPRQDPSSPYAAVVPRFLSSLAAGQPVPIHGDGSQSRDFTYVDDVVQANVLAATAPGVDGEVLNVAAGRACSVNALADALGEVLGRDVEKRYLPARPGDVRDSWADIGRARRRLGYEPRVALKDGLRRAAGLVLESAQA